MDEKFYVAFAVWIAKELYQNYKGSRSQTLSTVNDTKKEVIILQSELKNAASEINYLRGRVDFLVSEKREYRR